jgi:hypothetical protein
MNEQKPQKGHKPSLLARVYKTDDEWLQDIAEMNKLKSKAEALGLVHKLLDRTTETRITERFNELKTEIDTDGDMRGILEVMSVVTIKAYKREDYRNSLRERLEKVL